MPSVASIPYVFKNFKPGQAPQPILGDQLNANFRALVQSPSTTLRLTISGDTQLSTVQAENAGYEFSGTLSANAAITWLSYFGFAAIQNATTGNFSLVCGILDGGSTVTILPGEMAPVWSDGFNFIRLSQSQAGGTVAKVIPSSGGTIDATTQALLLVPAGTLATLTVVAPPSPLDGQIFGLSTTQSILAFTVNASAGQTLLGGSSSTLTANGGMGWVFYGSDNIWYRTY